MTLVQKENFKNGKLKSVCAIITLTHQQKTTYSIWTHKGFLFFVFFKGREKTAEEPRIVPKSLRLRGLGSEPLCGPHNYQGDYLLVHQGWGSHWQVHQPCDGLLQERDPAHCCDLFSLRALFRTTNCPLKLSFPGWNTKPS